MPVKRRAVLCAVGGTASFAGCTQTGRTDSAADSGSDGGDSNGDGGGGDDDGGDDDGGDGATTAASSTVRVAAHPELGDILVGPDGRTLYMFDQDTRDAGASACYDSCAEAWPPLTASETPTAGASVSAAVGTFERENGDAQVTADGWPLYYFVDDSDAGDVNGQGVNDVWWVLRPDGTPNRGTAATETATTASGGVGPY